MEGINSLADLDPTYKKVDKWKPKKLEKHYDMERGLVTAIRSTINRLEAMNQSYLDRASELVGETVTTESMHEYIEDVREKAILVELKSIDQFILTTVKDLDAERKRLHHHQRISELLLKMIKDKSI